MEPQPQTRYERPKATAEYFRIGQSTLWRWAKEKPGFPQPRKIGERVTLFDITAIEVWLQTQKPGV